MVSHIISSLTASYYIQINTEKEKRKAISYLAKNHSQGTWLRGNLDTPHHFGAEGESYVLGALVLFIIDMHMPRFEWQNIFKETDSHPFQILLDIFYEYPIPEFYSKFSDFDYSIINNLRRNKNVSIESFSNLVS